MNWPEELTRFGIAAFAAIVVLVPAVSGPGLVIAGRVVERVKALGPRTILLVAVGLTFATRAVVLPTFDPVAVQDVKEYVEKAAAIADEGHPRSQEIRADGKTHFYRTLGWSLGLAGWFKVTGTRSILSARWFNVLVACGVTALILALGTAVGTPTAGRLAALAYALHLPALIFSLVPYGETWATLLLVASAWGFERTRTGDASSRRRVARGLGTGLAMGLLVITRTEFLWLPPAAAVLLLMDRTHGNGGKIAAVAALLVGGMIPFAVNHQMRSGYPGTLRTSVQGGLILYFGNNPIDVNGHGNATPAVAAMVQEMYAKDRTGALARTEALDWMRENPLAVLRNIPKKAFHLWLAAPQGFGWHARAGEPGGLDRTAAAVMRWIAYAQSLALLIVGIRGLQHARPEHRFWVVVLLLHLAVWCMLATSPRNRYPLEPLLLIAGASWLIRKIERTSTAPATPTA